MSEPRRYPDEVKAHALELYAEHGPAEARELLREEGHDIPRSTLSTWADRSGVHGGDPAKTEAAVRKAKTRMEAKRVMLAERMLERANDLLDRMDEAHIDFRGGSGEKEPHQVEYPRATSSDVRNYAIAAAVCVDKSQLLSGEATERHDNVGERGAMERVAEVLGVEPDQVPDEIARRRAEKREAS